MTEKQHAEDQPVPPNLQAAERVNVALIPRAAGHMADLQTWLGLGKTDVVNRALAIYHLVEEEMRAGNKLLLVGPDGSTQQIRIL